MLPVALLLALSPASAAPAVVVSILPLHSLIAGVMDGVDAPVLLLQGGGSPHSYALKPSDARNLQNADAIFWVGSGLESFLAKPIRALPRHAKIVTLSQDPAVHLLAARAGGIWSEGDHDHATPLRDHDHAARTNHDLHIWLDPANAATIVRTAIVVLSTIDQANADAYRTNGLKVLQRLNMLENKVRGQLAPVKNRPYVVFHDAYHYFEKYFGMNAVGSISVAPDRPPGAKRLAQLRGRLGKLGAACVFAEPQFRPAIVATVTDGSATRAGVLDPLGANLAPGPDAYFHLMENLARSLRSCLIASS